VGKTFSAENGEKALRSAQFACAVCGGFF